jgi:hypothetical protein
VAEAQPGSPVVLNAEDGRECIDRGWLLAANDGTYFLTDAGHAALYRLDQL